MHLALKIALEIAESMLEKGSFAAKCWQFSGKSNPRTGYELCEENRTQFYSVCPKQTHASILK